MILPWECYMKLDACGMQVCGQGSQCFISSCTHYPVNCLTNWHGKWTWEQRYQARTGRNGQLGIHKGILNTALIEANYKDLAFGYFHSCQDLSWCFPPSFKRTKVFTIIHSVTNLNVPKNAIPALLNELLGDTPSLLYFSCSQNN